MGQPQVVVIDYGAGNIHSAINGLRRAGAEVKLSHQAEDILRADGVVVPGVGAYDLVMRALTASGAPRWLGQRIAGGRPVLGICVGHQVFFDEGIEHGIHTEGLGYWPGVVEKLHTPMLPHMGWNTVNVAEGSTMFAGIEEERFYFVHSYGVREWNFTVGNPKMRPPLVSWSHHGEDFIAAVENGPLWATQFHPEKSGAAGLALLRNWVKTL